MNLLLHDIQIILQSYYFCYLRTTFNVSDNFICVEMVINNASEFSNIKISCASKTKDLLKDIKKRVRIHV